MSKEYVISGHSDETTETFVIPYNVSLVFYANLGETCMVPHNKDSLDLVVNSMKYGQFELYRQGDTIQNYHITFNKKQYEGIALMQNNPDGLLNYDFLPTQENVNTLKDMCNFIQKSNNRANTLVYCVFCRGSKMEFEDYNFGDFNDQDIDKYLSDNDTEFYDLLAEDTNPSPVVGGKKYKTNNKSSKKRKKTNKKHKKLNKNIKKTKSKK